jgi:hypothetical protein
VSPTRRVQGLSEDNCCADPSKCGHTLREAGVVQVRRFWGERLDALARKLHGEAANKARSER